MGLTREEIRVRHHRHYAAKAGNPATLTIDEWIAILEHFHYSCAYCLHGRDFDSLSPLIVQRMRFELLEHITAIKNGGGTTAQNCVPACRSCNRRKDSKRLIDSLSIDQIEWVRSELAKALEIRPGELIASDDDTAPRPVVKEQEQP